jgi:hypothetical protein
VATVRSSVLLSALQWVPPLLSAAVLASVREREMASLLA